MQSESYAHPTSSLSIITHLPESRGKEADPLGLVVCPVVHQKYDRALKCVQYYGHAALNCHLQRGVTNHPAARWRPTLSPLFHFIDVVAARSCD
jgi:hypothetical protein